MPPASAKQPPRRRRAGYSLVEVLVVVGIVILLVSILLPVLGLLRRRAAVASAQQTVQQLVQCLESYRQADGMTRRFPPPQSDQCLADRPPAPGSSAVLLLLEAMRVEAPRNGPGGDPQGRLLDPWGQPYRYALVRPTPSDPAALSDWNWDAGKGRERAWGRRWDAAAGAIADGPLPFAYVWSQGPDKDPARAAGWIYARDAR